MNGLAFFYFVQQQENYNKKEKIMFTDYRKGVYIAEWFP
jgi:hypothetical protein